MENLVKTLIRELSFEPKEKDGTEGYFSDGKRDFLIIKEHCWKIYFRNTP